MNCEGDILRIFPAEMRKQWEKTAALAKELQEIRLRAGKEVLIYRNGEEYYLDAEGNLTRERCMAVRMEREELEKLLFYICRSSMYAYEEEMSRGYLTLSGGHRLGLAGEAIPEDNGRIRNLRHISAMNIRIAHEVKGAADSLLPYVYRNGRVENTLIVSPPGCGKTTLLRDLIRQVSDGNRWAAGQTVAVVDERSEIAGTFNGMAQNDVGMRTDVLDGCPKTEGMLMMLRSMTPRVLAVDELGGEEEIAAVRRACCSGCSILATIHASSGEEARLRLRQWGETEDGEKFLFGCCALLERKDGKYRIARITDGEGHFLGGGLPC